MECIPCSAETINQLIDYSIEIMTFESLEHQSNVHLFFLVPSIYVHITSYWDHYKWFNILYICDFGQ